MTKECSVLNITPLFYQHIEGQTYYLI